jgi:hypothetical protein
MYHNRRNIFTFHGHAHRISAPGVGRADISARTAVHILGSKVVTPFIKTEGLSRGTDNTHIQTVRVETDEPGRAGISAAAAVLDIGGQIAARSIAERLPRSAALSANARLPGWAGDAA